MSRSKYSMFPVEKPRLWDFYKKQSQAFWVPEEIDLASDLKDFDRLNKNEQMFIKQVLGFFAQSDGIVNENLALRFYQDVDWPEVRAFYAMQIAIEAIHAETYALLIDTYVKDADEREKLFNGITTIPTIGRKANWALEWISSDADFATRLFAFTIVEGLFFSASFASIFWLRSRGLMPGLCKSNEFISRDETLHWTFAAQLFRELGLQFDRAKFSKIIQEAVDIETEFVCESLPVSLIGMNNKDMAQYVRYTADRIFQYFGSSKLYGDPNPFPFMVLLDLQTKTNFFEGRVSDYAKGHNKTLAFDADF